MQLEKEKTKTKERRRNHQKNGKRFWKAAGSNSDDDDGGKLTVSAVFDVPEVSDCSSNVGVACFL